MTLHLSGTIGDQRMTWKLESSPVTIGRASSCGIQIADASVSRHHAEIVPRDERWFIRDLGSHNGTRVNGREARGPAEISPGTEIEVGDIVLRATAEAPGRRVVIPEGARVDSSVQIRADRLIEAGARGESEARGLVTLLSAAGQLLVMPKPLEETCDEILDVISRAVPASRQVLALRDEATGELHAMAERCCGGRPDRPLGLSRSIVDRVLDECTSVLTADAREDPRFRAHESVILQDVHSAMAVPLFDNRRVLGLVYVDSQDLSVAFTSAQLEVLTLLANMAAVKITNARLLEAEQARQRIAHELATAAQIQRGLLPPTPNVPGWRIEAWLETCHEVGGDLYDCRLRRDGRLLFLVGDVSGKGMGAALLMSSFLASARVLYETCSDPAELATRLSEIVRDLGDPGRYVTGFLGCLEPDTGALHYVNAGHPAAVLLGRAGITELESNGPPFGLLPEAGYQVRSARLEPGESLAVYSDGISEARRDEVLFGDDALRDALCAGASASDLAAMRRAVIAQLDEFLGDAPRGDDATLLLIRRDPAQPGAAPTSPRPVETR